MLERKLTSRTFDTGAIRDTDVNKPDYEGFLSPLVIERYGQFMMSHQKQADGSIRASDNWQKGVPKDVYIKSGFRHFMDWWKFHRGDRWQKDTMEEALCALMFNVMGYLHEHLKQEYDDPKELQTPLAYSPGERKTHP